MDPIAYPISDAAKASGTSRSAIYAALKRDELRAVKRGRRTLIEADELRRWLRALPAYQSKTAA